MESLYKTIELYKKKENREEQQLSLSILKEPLYNRLGQNSKEEEIAKEERDDASRLRQEA